MTWRRFVQVLGLGWSYAIVVLFYLIFILAYLRPQKQVVVAINRFSEAHLELLLLNVVVLPVVTVALYASMQGVWQD